MKVVKTALLLCFASFFAWGDDPIVDFRVLKTHEVEVDMVGQTGVKIIVSSTEEPIVLIENGPLAQCDASGFEKIDARSYLFRVQFDPILDDGANGCVVTILSSGRTRLVNLVVFVET